MTRPRCYNRPARPAFVQVNNGITADGRQARAFVPSAFVDRCATHDGKGIGANGESYPVAHGFDCNGCRWHPQGMTA